MTAIQTIVTSKRKSLDLFEKLQEKGIEEKWAIDYDQIKFSQSQKFASGSGGEIYKVEWRGLECVAKTCPVSVGEQVLTDLANEIKILSTLRHPNLIMFLGACFEPTKPPILLMEYCRGGNLETKLSKLTNEGSKMPMKQVCAIALDLALALNFLHNCNPPVVHRDLKPSNILFTKTNEVKITDFGLSKFIPKKSPKEIAKYTMTGETGSYRFMAPEVFNHEQYDEKVDVYSYSLILYWMLAGHRPFPDITDPYKAAGLAAKKERSPNGTLVRNAELKDLLVRGWSFTSEERPAFDEIVDVLKKVNAKIAKDSCSLQ